MQSLKIVNYTPSLFRTTLAATSELPDDSSLRHQGFVDHYYAMSGNCGLFLAVDGDGKVRGTLGVERMPFRMGGRAHVFGFGSNFNAFQPGVGAYLFFHWLRQCEGGIALGGTDEAHRMLTRVGWNYPAGIKTFVLNRSYEETRKVGRLQRFLRNSLRLVSQRRPLAGLTRRLPQPGNQEVRIVERNSFEDLSLDFESAFSFRFAPDRAYLAWRYSPGLRFVKYRIFQINRGPTTVGMVILQERPNLVIVSHADGSDPALLTTGIVQSLASISNNAWDRREIWIITPNAVMQGILQSVGFRNHPRWDRPLALGKLHGRIEVPGPMSQWLISYDWGDNGLRPPFLDQ